MIRKIFCLLMLVLSVGLTACDSKPPALMKAVKQFESDEIRDQHVIDMRKNHMDALKHKRDQTMYKGIRTEKNSINACINCHVPESHNGEVLRHTNPEHFCTTCHTYVAAKLDCFECHVDHPMKSVVAIESSKAIEENQSVIPLSQSVTSLNESVSSLNKTQLLELANRYVKQSPTQDISAKEKSLKSRGVSFLDNKQDTSSSIQDLKANNE